MSPSRASTAVAPSPGPGLVAPSLAITGFLMLLVVFLVANTAFGVKERMWPWEMLAQGDAALLGRVVFALWSLLAFWTLGMSFTKAYRLRSVVTLALGSALLVECSGQAAGFVIETYNLGDMLAMMCEAQ